MLYTGSRTFSIITKVLARMCAMKVYAGVRWDLDEEENAIEAHCTKKTQKNEVCAMLREKSGEKMG